MNGVNLALKWRLCSFEIQTNLTTMLGWVGLVVTDEKRMQIKGAVGHCLGVLEELIDKFSPKLIVIFVPSERNKANVLTRVKKA